MSLNWPKPGPNHVPSYIVSGIPYVTQSATTEVPNTGTPAHVHTFPFVTKFFTVQNIGGNELRVGFSDAGVRSTTTANYIPIAAGQQSKEFKVRCKELYFYGQGGTTGYRIIAGLTLITGSSFPELNSTNGFSGV